MRFFREISATFFLLTSLGCAAQPSPAGKTGSIFVEGRGRVVSVDQMLGQAVLEIGGTNVHVYWQTERTYAQPGSSVANGPLAAPTGAYRETVVRKQQFDANPGDIIAYVGLQTGNEILLRGIQVIARQ